MPPEVVFHIVRPSIKPISTLTESERLELVGNCKNIYEAFKPEEMLIPNYTGILTATNVEGKQRANIWNAFTPEFYTIFWLLSLENIYIPVDMYFFYLPSLTPNKIRFRS